MTLKVMPGRNLSAAIKKYHGKTVVVKYGGAAMVSDELKEAFAQEIVYLRSAGVNVVVVHGGGKEITSIAGKLGLATTFIEGQRYTDAAMIDVVQMVLAGKLNQDVVALMNRFHGRAVGVSGIDAGLLKVRRATGDFDLGFVGEIVNVDTSYIDTLTNAGIIPVIAPVGCDDNGQVYNINADVAAADIARALQADMLFFLSDVDGVHAGGSRLARLSEDEAEEMIATGVINNGMIPKMRSAFLAMRCGVGSVHLVDGRVKQSILRELLASTPTGTELCRSILHTTKEMAG